MASKGEPGPFAQAFGEFWDNRNPERELEAELTKLLHAGSIIVPPKRYNAYRAVHGKEARDIVKKRALLNRAAEIGRRIFEAFMQEDGSPFRNTAHQDVFDELSKDLRNNGAFLEAEGYSNAELRRMIKNFREYIVIRGGAELLFPRASMRYVSGQITRIAPEDPRAPLITTVPNPDDQKDLPMFHEYEGGSKEEGMRIARDIHAYRNRIAVITDVFTLDPAHTDGISYRNRGIAKNVEQETERVMQEEIDPIRGEEARIRYYIANMFDIQGLSLEGGHSLVLPKSIPNLVSIILHLKGVSSHFKSTFAWWFQGKPISVRFRHPLFGGEIRGNLETRWQTVVLERLDRSLPLSLPRPAEVAGGA